MRLMRCEVPTPFLRTILLRSGVGRGVSNFAGASRSNAANDVESGDVSVISLAISAEIVRCDASAVLSADTASGESDLFATSASICAIGSAVGATPGVVEALANDLLSSPRYCSWSSAASRGATSPNRSFALGICAISFIPFR